MKEPVSESPPGIAIHMTGSVTDAVFSIGLQGQIIACSKSAEKIFGYTSEEMAGKPVKALVAEGHREELGKMLSAQCAGAYGITGEKKDGALFPLELTVLKMQAAGDAPVASDGIIAVFRNLGSMEIDGEVLPGGPRELLFRHRELNRLFAQVEEAKKAWERTTDCVGDMIILVDRQQRIKRYNLALKEFLDRAHEEIIGQDWKHMLAEKNKNAVSEVPGGGEFFHEATGRWFLIRSYPFFSDSGEEKGNVITIHDSTQLKKISRELAETNERIEKDRETLSKALYDLQKAHSQMLQQEKMASVGQLAAGVAHEINNPVGFIMSNLNCLQKYSIRLLEFMDIQSEALAFLLDRAGSGGKEITDKIEKLKAESKLDFIRKDMASLIRESFEGAERVKNIVRDLKGFSRADDAHCKLGDINAGIESTVNIIWNEIKYKAALKKNYGDIPLTVCNLGQLNQVFMNLLMNSVQAIEKNGEITVNTWNGDGSIYVSVADTGCGIPEKDLGRIFEPFFTTKEVGTGTGLGLSMAYDIIKKHNGDIKVESSMGAGTTFTVRLPIIQ